MKKILTNQLLFVVALFTSMQMSTIGAFIAVPTSVAVVGIAGCSLSKPQVLQLADTLDNSLASLATAINDPALAAQVKAAEATLNAAITNWNGTTVTTAIVSALNNVVSVMGLIPGAAPYAALASIVIAGVEAIIDAFPSTPVTASAKTMAKSRIAHSAVKVKSVSDYKTQWNAWVAANPTANVKPI
jgi:hypothetical protein